MISQSSPAKYHRSQLGLWDEYAHHAIVIHAGSSLAWWTFSLAKQPTYAIAWLCCLASGWLLVRQCTRLTYGNLWCMLISVVLVSLLGWQGISAQSTVAAHWETIFAWWVLAVLLVGCELIAFLDRRQRSQPHLSQLNMESPAEDDMPQPPLAASTNLEYAAQGVTTSTHPEGVLGMSVTDGLTKAPTSNWGMKWALLLIASLLFVYMVVVPSIGYIIEQVTPPKTGLVADDMSFTEKMRLHSVSGVVVLMFLALGATIGSFLNVFIYRVPRGRALLWPPSSCASCGTRIHGRDNVPVLGWFLISGRCRTCAQPISARYPIIEAVVATVFIALYYVELLSGGENIPVRSPNMYRGIVWILLYTKWDLVGLYTYHCLMLSLLLSVGMINVDGFRLPWKHAGMLLVAFAAASLAIPALHPVPAPFVPAFATCLVGAAFGGAIGTLMQVLLPVFRCPRSANVDEETELNATDFQHAPEALSTAVSDTGISDTAVSNTGISVDDPSPDEIEPASSSSKKTLVGDQASKYGESAIAPTIYTDAAFGMTLIGIVLGPQAVISVSALLLPIAVIYYMSRTVRRIPITIFLFAIAFAHQLFWVQLHRLFSFGA